MQSKRALLALALVGTTCAAGLSWPVCDQYEMAWSTDTPHLTGHYPFYNLICAQPPSPPSLATLLIGCPPDQQMSECRLAKL